MYERKGIRSMNEMAFPVLDGCTDMDIQLIPFRNSLPIKQLKLKPNEEQEIKVVYINVFEPGLKPVRQLYQNLSNVTYGFQNIPNNFEAAIKVDTTGFVIDYPGLFSKMAFGKPIIYDHL